MSKIIMGIQLQQRHETAQAVQEVLTKYGCIIKTRLGVHQASVNACSEQGLIILEFMEKVDEEIIEMKDALESIRDVVVKTMEF